MHRLDAAAAAARTDRAGRAMTLMLASVSDAAEAAVALDAGADVIDLIPPAQAAPGGVAPALTAAIVAQLGGRCVVSALAGDLAAEPPALAAAVRALAAAGAGWIRVGLPAGDDLPARLAVLTPLSRNIRLIGMLYADEQADFTAVAALAAAGFAGAMLDTPPPQGGRLLDQLDLPALARFVAACGTGGLLCGLAGALETPDLPRLLLLAPGLLLCRAAPGARGRAGWIDPARLRLLRALIPAPTTADRAAARGGPVTAAVTDTLFVRDFVLPVEIGAYSSERGRTHRVRFDVSVLVARAGPTRDMRDVYSYDLISDGIRILVAAGHVDFVETLAERIAAMLLGDARVVKAMVQVTKLETGSGEVGVAIERSRAP